MKKLIISAVLTLSLVLVVVSNLVGFSSIATISNPILFTVQPPFFESAQTVTAVFGNHRPSIDLAPRGGDLMVRYPDGIIRNLTKEAGYGLTAVTEINVREPAVHWSGTKALFSMVIGGTTPGNFSPVYWQIYEITGILEGQTVSINHLNQPTNRNNISPIYGTDDRVIFTSDLPPNGLDNCYPSLDEYEVTPCNTGLWSMFLDGSRLTLLEHSPSGDFTPLIDSYGRLIFTRWDHLQRDKFWNDGVLTTFGAVNYTSESSTVQTTAVDIFPEKFVALIPPDPSYIFNPHQLNMFLPWMMNEDGSHLETLNHIGRHELLSYIQAATTDGKTLPYSKSLSNPINNTFLHIKEDPNISGKYYGITSYEFGTDSAGQIILMNAQEGFNADSMSVVGVTSPISQFPITDGQPIPPGHPGMFRNPLPLSTGTLLAVKSDSPYTNKKLNLNTPLGTTYNFRIVIMGGSGYLTAQSDLIPSGIVKNVSYWDNYKQKQAVYTGRLWELSPVEVIPREIPDLHIDPLPQIETDMIVAKLGTSGPSLLKRYLERENLAMVVCRDVTRRNDLNQYFNLKVFGTSKVTAFPGATPIDILYTQFVQADLIRAYNSFNAGRRICAVPMHDGILPIIVGAPDGAAKIEDDGSVAAFVPAGRAMSWQILKPDASAVIRERYWVSFAPGEMRSCTNCHGINTTDKVLNLPPPTNPPKALDTLLNWYILNH